MLSFFLFYIFVRIIYDEIIAFDSSTSSYDDTPSFVVIISKLHSLALFPWTAFYGASGRILERFLAWFVFSVLPLYFMIQLCFQSLAFCDLRGFVKWLVIYYYDDRKKTFLVYSLVMAEKRGKRSGKGNQDRLYRQGMEKLAVKKELEMKRQNEAVDPAMFKPKINKTKHSGKSNRESRFDRLYRQGQSKRVKQDAMHIAKLKDVESECTFQPKTNNRRRGKRRQRPKPPTEPRKRTPARKKFQRSLEPLEVGISKYDTISRLSSLKGGPR